jgi:MFS transporter, SP family, sugar:H+ symporter
VLSLGVEQYGRKALLVCGGLGQALPMQATVRSIREGSTEIDCASYVAIVMIYL